MQPTPPPPSTWDNLNVLVPILWPYAAALLAAGFVLGGFITYKWTLRSLDRRRLLVARPSDDRQLNRLSAGERWTTLKKHVREHMWLSLTCLATYGVTAWWLVRKAHSDEWLLFERFAPLSSGFNLSSMVAVTALAIPATWLLLRFASGVYKPLQPFLDRFREFGSMRPVLATMLWVVASVIMAGTAIDFHMPDPEAPAWTANLSGNFVGFPKWLLATIGVLIVWNYFRNRRRGASDDGTNVTA